jgi:hypothetical protein
MKEIDPTGNIAANHDGKHHGAIVHDADSDDNDIGITETHEVDEHGHRQEENRKDRRSTTMKTTLASALTILALLIAICAASPTDAIAATIKDKDITITISDQTIGAINVVDTDIRNGIANLILDGGIANSDIVAANIESRIINTIPADSIRLDVIPTISIIERADRIVG